MPLTKYHRYIWMWFDKKQAPSNKYWFTKFLFWIHSSRVLKRRNSDLHPQKPKVYAKERFKYLKTKSNWISIYWSLNDKRLNTIIGCIYKHPKATVNEFTNDFMLPLLEKLSLEKKEIMLMVDFNTNLLRSDLDKETSNFMDNIYSNFFSQQSTYQLA